MKHFTDLIFLYSDMDIGEGSYIAVLHYCIIVKNLIQMIRLKISIRPIEQSKIQSGTHMKLCKSKLSIQDPFLVIFMCVNSNKTVANV